jgi:hypothetical protein
MVCDFWGEIVVPPFDFALNERGFQNLAVVLARAEAERDASWVRVGLEQAGHYHRPLQARLYAHGLDVTLFNPAQVKANRNLDLLRSLKSDAFDLAAMAELLIRGKGRRWAGDHDAIAMQAAVAAHRARKVKAHVALKNQIHAHLDLVFPGLAGCFDSILATKLGRLLVEEAMTPNACAGSEPSASDASVSTGAWSCGAPRPSRSSTPHGERLQCRRPCLGFTPGCWRQTSACSHGSTRRSPGPRTSWPGSCPARRHRS